MTIALIDSDIVAFRCAAVSENEPEDIAIVRTDKLMREILEATQADSYLAFLTGRGNFRKQINPDYKANRKDKEPPKHLQICREFLKQDWSAIVIDGYEADDALGINQTSESVICSIDKDLLQIPGKHYNFVKQEWLEVSELEGIRHFYKQMLIGDTSDNIKGIDKIGPVKAEKLLGSLEKEKDMFWVVSDLYSASSEPDGSERFWMNADCLWIWRKEGGCYSLSH